MTIPQRHNSQTLTANAPKGSTPLTSETSVEISPYFVWKGWLMRIIGALLLLMHLPIIFLLLLLVRCTSNGPGLYQQKRAGKNGKVFNVYKIRSMYNNAEQLTGPVWCRPGDSRITPVGKVLRFLYLDELPQLFNVTRGDMCLTGPRPERPEIVATLLKDIPNYCDRLEVLPGITGMAQINLPADVDVDSARAKLFLALEYIRTASLGLDMRILLCTALRVLGVRGGYASRWLKLDRSVPSGVERPSADDVVRVELSPFLEPAYQSSAVIPDGGERRDKATIPTVKSDSVTAAVAINGRLSQGITEPLSKRRPR